MRTAVVILNWNNVDYLRAFAPGILASLGSDDRLYVADSGSADASLEWLTGNHPEVGLIPLGKNFGFAEGYNRALSTIKDAEYYVLLNSDIEVAEDWLEPLVQWMQTHPETAVCGPKLHALDPDGKGGWTRTDRFEYAGAAGGMLDHYCYPYCRGRALQRVEQDCGQYDNPAKVFWVTGACMVVRSSVWRELGGLDGEFFAHMEEIDFCWRTQLAGYEVWTVPQSVVWHIGGGTLRPSSPLKLKLNYRNSIWMMRRNLPATIGPRRARWRIGVRQFLDVCTQIVYFLSGKRDYVRAVRQARQEEKERKTVPLQAAGAVKLSGVRIIPAYFLRGKKVFEYLRRYENSH